MAIAKVQLRQVLLLVICVSFSSLAHAGESAAEKLTVFLQSVVTFKSQFEQTVLSPQGDLIESAQGQFILERPGKFRWDYLSPYPQEIVADGLRIWFYDVDLEQVTVQSQQDALTDTPASLLSGEMLPGEKYQVRDVASDDGLSWVELTPKDTESSFQTVRFAFDKTGLRQMVMQDSFDQYTRLVFSDAHENIELDDGVFNFVIPDGVDVVGDVNQ
ncbi:MAG: outer membrane lipoprotein carrier protein [Methylophagaceae bacterium]|jgi:outer membrane lipoprotein carrier protein